MTRRVCWLSESTTKNIFSNILIFSIEPDCTICMNKLYLKNNSLYQNPSPKVSSTPNASMNSLKIISLKKININNSMKPNNKKNLTPVPSSQKRFLPKITDCLFKTDIFPFIPKTSLINKTDWQRTLNTRRLTRSVPLRQIYISHLFI